MSTQRVGLRALQQVARPNAVSQNIPRLMFASLQARPVSTTKVTPAEASAQLAAQRRLRPVSPHLGAYDPAQTWFAASVWTRITGGGFAAGLYGFSIAYVAAPLAGWHLESASLVAAAAALPAAVAAGLKFLLAWPFAFHCLNGARHLAWDLAAGFARPQIRAGNWAVWGASLVAGLGMAFLL
ncbi:putative succinate dehydrogenase cytochrome b subunit [Rosellinia necatrix]|uniref:Putative succinate dehydrogenase cytochrome b subunit n=1 Tax=Rosellinia necatrix TaxID=77044 RepID=A0A1W2TS63_ROSNE|nr:putative succinate dehydrogenase cytochrome b subunit [Rosellinia necatrix]